MRFHHDALGEGILLQASGAVDDDERVYED
jgi:hypothetical protein